MILASILATRKCIREQKVVSKSVNVSIFTSMPYKINVTAVKKGATTNTQTFGGATFGAGAGITWTKD